MLHGLGIDIVEIERVELAIQRQGGAFLRRVFTDNEQDYCSSMPNPNIHFAARFAAKEAVSKAFGTGIGENAGWREIEIYNEEGGAPKVFLHGNARAFAIDHGIAEVQVSMTHTEEYAAANAVALRHGG